MFRIAPLLLALTALSACADEPAQRTMSSCTLTTAVRGDRLDVTAHYDCPHPLVRIYLSAFEEIDGIAGNYFGHHVQLTACGSALSLTYPLPSPPPAEVLVTAGIVREPEGSGVDIYCTAEVRP